MKLDELKFNEGENWAHSLYKGWDFYRAVTGLTTTIKGNYDIHRGSIVIPIYKNVDPLMAQAILCAIEKGEL